MLKSPRVNMSRAFAALVANIIRNIMRTCGIITVKHYLLLQKFIYYRGVNTRFAFNVSKDSFFAWRNNRGKKKKKRRKEKKGRAQFPSAFIPDVKC